MEPTDTNDADRSPASNNRREAERFGCPVELALILCGASREKEVAPCVARVKDISRTGALVKTDYPIEQSQNVKLEIATKHCPEELNLPKTFAGDGLVVRVMVESDGAYLVRLRFGDALACSTEFAVFIDFLHVRFGLLDPPPDMK